MASDSVDYETHASLSLIQSISPPAKPIGALRYTSESPAWHCVFSRDGEWLAACFGAPDLCIRIWKHDAGEWVLHSTLDGIHSKSIRYISFAPLSSTQVLAAASFDGSVSVWEYEKKNDEWADDDDDDDEVPPLGEGDMLDTSP